MKILLRILFVIVFALIATYIVKYETNRYESTSIVLLKDLSKKQNMELSALATLGQTSNTMQDSKVVELYIRSNEMFEYIDKLYNLHAHYTSNILDKVQRLYVNSMLPSYSASKKNLLKKYNDNLFVIFDEPSGTLSIGFIHTDPKIAKKILQSIIEHSDIVINKFDKENAQVALDFIAKQKKVDKVNFNTSIKKLITYQNKHHTIDPNLDVERKNTILASLEAELIKMEVEYSSKSKTYNLNGSEMKILKETVLNIKKSIKRVKAQMVGSGDLNANVFNFELLKNNMQFNKEIYKQALINHEELKLEVSQNAKHLLIISHPTLADSYSYPNKIWDIFTLWIILFFLYTILVTIVSIIKDHKD
jgi:capsular polysaccharide transport system permease protein